MRVEAVQMADVDRRFLLVGSLPDIQGREGITPDGRPSYTIPYRNGRPGKVVFRGDVAETVSLVGGLREGEQVARKDLMSEFSRPGNTIKFHIGAIREGLAQSGIGVTIESQNAHYFLIPEEQAIERPENMSPHVKGKLEFEILNSKGRTTALAGKEAEVFDALVNSGSDLDGEAMQEELIGLADILEAEETGIEIVIDGDGKPGLLISRDTAIEEVWAIDLGDLSRKSISLEAQNEDLSQVDSSALPQDTDDKLYLPEGVTELLYSSTAALMVDQASYAQAKGEVALFVRKSDQREEVSMEVVGDTRGGFSDFQARLVAVVRDDMDMPAPTEVYTVVAYPLDAAVPIRGTAGSRTSSVSAASTRTGDGLRAQLLPRWGVPNTESENDVEAVADDTIRRAFSRRAKEVAANKALQYGATSEQLIKELPDEVIRYKNNQEDQPVTYLELLGDRVPKRTRADRHRPWDIASILVLMDYNGRLTSEQEAQMIENSEAVYLAAKAQFAAENKRAKEGKRVSQSTIERRLRVITNEVATSESTHDRMTAKEIEIAFPELANFVENYGQLFPQHDGHFTVAQIIAARSLAFYGTRLYPKQAEYILKTAEPAYMRWLENREERKVKSQAEAPVETGVTATQTVHEVPEVPAAGTSVLVANATDVLELTEVPELDEELAVDTRISGAENVLDVPNVSTVPEAPATVTPELIAARATRRAEISPADRLGLGSGVRLAYSTDSSGAIYEGERPTERGGKRNGGSKNRGANLGGKDKRAYPIRHPARKANGEGKRWSGNV